MGVKMKRFLKVSILVFLFIVLLSVYVNAAETSGIYGSVEWVFDDAIGKLTISGSGDIPDATTASDHPWYEYRRSIKEVEIGSSIKRIGSLSFASCSNLTDISMGDNINSIGTSAFTNCSSLKKIELPKKLTVLSANLFYDCTSLEEIVIPENVTYIGPNAFYRCTNLKSIEIGEEIITIKSDAFFGCDNLNSVYIKNLENWCSVEMEDLDSSPFYNGADLYVNGEKITDLIFDSKLANITKINNYVFYGCESIVKINVGGSINEIGKYAFGNCTNIKSVLINDSVTKIGNGAFNKCTSLEKVELSDNLSGELSIAMFGYCPNLVSIKLPSGITSIGALAFRNCTGLTRIEIPKGVASIGEGAFLGCTNITDIYFSGSEAEWKSITVNQYNDVLKNAVVHYNTELKEEAVVTYTYVDGNVVIQGENITDGSIIIIKGIKDGVDTVYVRKYAYDEDISIELGEGYDNIKIMVWKSFNALMPLCESVIVR